MDNDPVRSHYEANLLLLDHWRQMYPEIPVAFQPYAVCSRCAAVRLDHLNGKNTPDGEKYYFHSPSFHALVASVIRKCPMCMLMLQGLITTAGLGDLTSAFTVLDHKQKDRYITLQAVRRPWDEDEAGANENEIIRAVEVRIEGWMSSLTRALLPIFALPGTGAATCWNVQVSIPSGDKEKWKRIRRWFDQQARLLVGRRMRLPTRLIDLGTLSQETGNVRLVETSSLPEPAAAEPYRYIALSYRWGEGNRLLTEESTYIQRQTAIDMESIPRTIRDAVLVARRLGVQYLWIDALCIIQDDEQDWKKEAARMGDIYMNALCTIAAHAADHADCGFLQEAMGREPVVACGGKRFIDGGEKTGETTTASEKGADSDNANLGVGARERQPGFVDYSMEMNSYKHFVARVDSSSVEDSLEQLSLSSEIGHEQADPAGAASISPSSQSFLVAKGTYARHHLDRTELSSRGWVMQERILSPRTIHFGKAGALYFETRDKVEHIDVGKENGYRPFPGLRDALGVLDKLQGENDEAPSLSRLRENPVPFQTRNDIGEKITVLKSPDELIYHGWFELVARYSGCMLTKSKDKLVALSGIVRKCQQINKDRYVSGIWLHPDRFHICLLWLGVGKEPLVRDTEAGAPSWSWASALGQIQYIHGQIMMEREVPHIKSEVKLEAVHPGTGVDGDSDTIEGKAALELSNVVMINRVKTALRLVHFRAGIPWHYSIHKYINFDKPARIWDIHDDDGERIGWASLDTHPGVSEDVLQPSDEGITCFKIAVHDNDRPRDGKNRGYVVMFVMFDQAYGVWKRVGLGQITKRDLFDGVEGTTIRLG